MLILHTAQSAEEKPKVGTKYRWTALKQTMYEMKLRQGHWGLLSRCIQGAHPSLCPAEEPPHATHSVHGLERH